MRITLTLAVCCVAFGAISQSSNHTIWSTRTVYVDYVKSDSSSCDNVTYGPYDSWYTGFFSDIRSTVVTDSDTADFYPLTTLPSGHSWEWKFIRYSGPNTPEVYDFVTDTVQCDFYKSSTLEQGLYDDYAVILYHKYPSGFRWIADLMHVYVLPEKIGASGPFHFGFDATDISTAPADELGHFKNISYPTFSGSANQRMDLHNIREKVDGNCVYPAYLSQAAMGDEESAARLGTGCMHIWNPDTDETLGMRDIVDVSGCPEYDENYDHCADPCALNAFTDTPDTYANPSKSHTAKVEANFFPHHVLGDDYYYAFSFKVPADFDETGMSTALDGYGANRYHIMAEFHQSPWPIDESAFGVNCQATMQFCYLGGGKVGMNYGLTGFNRCGFGPWDYTPGEWMDVIFHVTWGQVTDPDNVVGDWTASHGEMEVWLSDGSGYEKQCLIPATDRFRSFRAVGTKQANIGPFDWSADKKSLYGPNLENVNPPYMSLLSMRGDSAGVHGFDFQSDVFFDELRIGETLEDVKTPGSLFLDENLLDCSTFEVSYELRREEEVAVSGIQIQPNPAQSEVVVRAAIAPNQTGELLIRDASGRVVYNEFIPALPLTEFQSLVLLHGLPSGVYLLEVSQGELRRVERLIVQR